VRAPFLSKEVYLLRGGKRGQAVRSLYSFAHAEVVRREDVGTSEIHEQYHVRRPLPYALDCCEPLSHLVVGEFSETLELKGTALDVLGEVACVRDFLP
jgi:hypothetical protein